MQVRAWVLAATLDDNAAPQLGKRPCGACGSQTYEAALVCHACDARCTACFITGTLRWHLAH